MRILHLNLEKSWRGGERQTLFTVQGLKDAGNSVALIARAGSPLAQAAKNAYIDVYECSNTWSLAWQLLKLANKFDVIHAQTAQSASILAFLKPFISGLTVFTKRTAFDKTNKRKRQRWKWSRIKVLVAISEAAARTPKSFGLAVDIIPSAVKSVPPDAQVVKELSAKYALADRIVLVTAAALSSEKDPLTLIKAVDQLRSIFPNIVCLHCGADSDAAASARALVAELGLEENYIFTGFQTRVTDFLALANIYVSSSQFEALGTSVLDACLAKLPVVATDTGGHKEILMPDYGLLTPVGDSEAMAKKITWLLQHQDVANDMAKRAHEMVAEQFAVPTMVNSYISLYKANLNRIL